MMNYFLLLHIFQTTRVNARWGQPWLNQPQSFSKTSLRLAVFVCYVLVESSWLLFMVSFIPMNVNKFRIPNTKHFIKGGNCETFKGVNVVVYWWWMQGNGAWKQSGGDASILLLNFYVLPALSSQLSVFSKLCIMNTLLHFLLLLCQSCHCLRSVSFCGRILGLIKVLITVGWVWWRHQKSPLFSLASGSPNLKPTTAHKHWRNTAKISDRSNTIKFYLIQVR